MRSILIALGAFVASIAAAPSSNHVLHEKRDRLPPGWGQERELEEFTVLPMKIGLTQGNLDKADEYLAEISHPDSPKYGQHWSAKQIAETFAPTQETVDSVMAWLQSSGIEAGRISRSQSLGWLHFDATVAEAEELLKTKYKLYTHELTGKPHVACEEYHIPGHVSRHVDFITPTVHFDSRTPMAQEGHANKVRQVATTTAAAGHPVKTKAALGVGAPGSGSLPKKGTNINIKGIIDELKNWSVFLSFKKLYATQRPPKLGDIEEKLGALWLPSKYSANGSCI